MSTKKNNYWLENITLWTGGFILGAVIGKFLFKMHQDTLMFDILYIIGILGISLVLLGWLAEWKGDSLENY